LWIKAESNLVLSLDGTYADPAARAIAAGGTFLAGTGLEVWSPTYPAGVSAWSYDADVGRWSTRFDAELASESDPPAVLSPGAGVYLKANTPQDLQTRDPTLRIRYYHEDHLGSSSVITDASGALVEETAFYAFGRPHNQYMPRQIHEPYQFTQKERDQESSFHYFEARFYAATIGRWLSCDPAGTEAGLNPYRFVKNNPVRLIDPTGHDDVNPGMLQAAAYGMHCNPGNGFNWKSMAAASPDFGTALNSVCTATPSSPDTWKNNVASAFAGIGDSLSFIVDTEQMRKDAGINIVDENSGWYIGGRVTGCAANTYAGSKAGNPT
jgi:RHS repeat-associated protein